jgi:hypothetical protein
MGCQNIDCVRLIDANDRAPGLQFGVRLASMARSVEKASSDLRGLGDVPDRSLTSVSYFERQMT